MTAEASTRRHYSTARPAAEKGLVDANRIVDGVKCDWRDGKPPDAVGVLASHPELLRFRSIALDLAYTEYRLRLQAGETLHAETFAQRFPSLQRSLYLLIKVQSLLSHDPELQSLQESLPWPKVGGRFLQFDLVAEIGRGAFGRVYLAREPDVGDRKIVVKITPHGEGEADILGKLRHSNIVPIYSFHKDADSGLTAFCMPYMGRATLCDVLDASFPDGQAPLRSQVILDTATAVNNDQDAREYPSPAKVLREGSYVDGVVYLAAQLADALAHAHGRGICHRDLKPSNVLLTCDGRPLLLDFNLSIDADLPAWKVGGTLPYMPPEELANLVRRDEAPRSFRYDPRSDLFSLGVIIYELLTGRLPFGEMQQEKTLTVAACQLHDQQRQGPRPLRELNRRVDGRLARLIEDCLAFEPDRRPRTAQELAASLRLELSRTRRCRRWISNHRVRAIALGSIPLALAFVMTVVLALRPPYDVRQFQVGLHQLDEGDYSSALDSFNSSIRSNPNSAEALFARGRAYHRLGKFEAAFSDYDDASKIGPTAALIACKAYCLNRINSHRAALALYDAALKAKYNRPLLLYNNMGFSYLALKQFSKAEESFRRALELDHGLAASQYGMLKLSLRRALDGQPVTDAALAQASEAIRLGPPTADLYRVVAALYAVAARGNPRLTNLAIEYVRQSVALGFDPKMFSTDSSFSALWREPSLRDALQQTPSSGASAMVVQLLDPLDTP